MANVSAVPALSAIPSQIGRYKIVCELGQGGMGTIYLGRAEGIGGFERLMAIKMIHPHLSKQQSFINMFLDEARIAALIRHPNVVPVYEIGEHHGRHFIAMDYVSGEPLSTLLDSTWCRGIPLDFDIVAYIISVVCEALHAAHDLVDPTGRALKVVHRDVCPQNVMLGYDGIIRVMDFGVAKAVDQLSQTRPGTHKGKVPYMAPEQIRCQPIDRRSDIFSLGVVLWESTIGKRLFKAENDILSASKVLRGKVPRPGRARAHYPMELELIVLKALNPHAEKRFQTAREMGQALREYLSRRDARVSPSDLERLLKTICKNRYERRTDMELRASVDHLDSGPIEEETMQLFAAGESNLPNFDIENALQPLNEAKELRSMVSARKVYEYEDELDDATVQTQLEEIGFIGTTEFNLLEDDPFAPKTVIEPVPTQISEAITGETDTRRVSELVNASHALQMLAAAEVDVDRKSGKRMPRFKSIPDFVSDASTGRELTPVQKLVHASGKRGLAVIGASLVAVALVAFGLVADDDETSAPEAAPSVAEAKSPAPIPPPVQEVKVPVSPIEMEKSLPKIETRARPPAPKPEKKEPPPPPEVVEEEVVEVEEAPPPVLHAELDEDEKQKIAQRSKKKRRDRRMKPEKKKSPKPEERFLVGPDDL